MQSELDKCPGAKEMVEYLHKLTEKNRARVARELHDGMGGLLVAVVMDIAFAEQNDRLDDHLRQRLERMRRTVTEAIDLKRKIIEDLRPVIVHAVSVTIQEECETGWRTMSIGKVRA